MLKMMRRIKIKYKKGSRFINVNGYNILIKGSIQEIQEVARNINKSKGKKGDVINKILEVLT